MPQFDKVKINDLSRLELRYLTARGYVRQPELNREMHEETMQRILRLLHFQPNAQNSYRSLWENLMSVPESKLTNPDRLFFTTQFDPKNYSASQVRFQNWQAANNLERVVDRKEFFVFNKQNYEDPAHFERFINQLYVQIMQQALAVAVYGESTSIHIKEGEDQEQGGDPDINQQLQVSIDQLHLQNITLQFFPFSQNPLRKYEDSKTGGEIRIQLSEGELVQKILEEAEQQQNADIIDEIEAMQEREEEAKIQNAQDQKEIETVQDILDELAALKAYEEANKKNQEEEIPANKPPEEELQLQNLDEAVQLQVLNQPEFVHDTTTLRRKRFLEALLQKRKIQERSVFNELPPPLQQQKPNLDYPIYKKRQEQHVLQPPVENADIIDEEGPPPLVGFNYQEEKMDQEEQKQPVPGALALRARRLPVVQSNYQLRPKRKIDYRKLKKDGYGFLGKLMQQRVRKYSEPNYNIFDIQHQYHACIAKVLFHAIKEDKAIHQVLILASAEVFDDTTNVFKDEFFNSYNNFPEFFIFCANPSLYLKQGEVSHHLIDFFQSVTRDSFQNFLELFIEVIKKAKIFNRNNRTLPRIRIIDVTKRKRPQYLFKELLEEKYEEGINSDFTCNYKVSQSSDHTFLRIGVIYHHVFILAPGQLAPLSREANIQLKREADKITLDPANVQILQSIDEIRNKLGVTTTKYNDLPFLFPQVPENSAILEVLQKASIGQLTPQERNLKAKSLYFNVDQDQAKFNAHQANFFSAGPSYTDQFERGSVLAFDFETLGGLSQKGDINLMHPYACAIYGMINFKIYSFRQEKSSVVYQKKIEQQFSIPMEGRSQQDIQADLENRTIQNQLMEYLMQINKEIEDAIKIVQQNDAKNLEAPPPDNHPKIKYSEKHISSRKPPIPLDKVIVVGFNNAKFDNKIILDEIIQMKMNNPQDTHLLYDKNTIKQVNFGHISIVDVRPLVNNSLGKISQTFFPGQIDIIKQADFKIADYQTIEQIRPKLKDIIEYNMQDSKATFHVFHRFVYEINNILKSFYNRLRVSDLNRRYFHSSNMPLTIASLAMNIANKIFCQQAVQTGCFAKGITRLNDQAGLTKNIEKHLRLSYFGGFVNAFSIKRYIYDLLSDIYNNENFKIAYLDINSLYPSVMSRYSTRLPIRLRGFRAQKIVLDSEEKFEQFMKQYAECEQFLYQVESFEFHEGQLVTFPTRLIDKGLIYVRKSPGEPSYRWGWTLFGAMKRKNLKSVTISGFYEFESDDRFTYLATYVDYLYSRRVEAKALKQEALDYIIKLLLNTLYGKFGQGEFPTKLYMTTKDFNELTIELQEEQIFQLIKSTKPLDLSYNQQGANFEAEDQIIEVEVLPGKNYNVIGSLVHIASAITAIAREELFNAIQIAGGPHIVIYADTDSIITTLDGAKKLQQAGLIDNSKLGYMKHEVTLDYDYCEFQALGQKIYDFKAYQIFQDNAKQISKSAFKGVEREGPLRDKMYKSLQIKGSFKGEDDFTDYFTKWQSHRTHGVIRMKQLINTVHLQPKLVYLADGTFCRFFEDLREYYGEWKERVITFNKETKAVEYITKSEFKKI